MQSARVVNLIDEVWEPCGHVGIGLLITEINLLTLDGFHKTLGLAIIIGIAATAHRTD